MSKMCSKCKEIKDLSGFSKRAKSKKTGEQLYLSWCRLCNLKRQKERDNPVERHRGTVDPKYLSRGSISYEGLGKL